MKKLLWLIILALTLSTATASITHADGLCDFTKTGMTFVEKGVNGQTMVDLTPLLRVSGYSAQNPETKEFTFEALIIPPREYNKYSEKKLSAAEETIMELKRRGETGKISLPAFKIISKMNNEKNEEIIVMEGFNLLTNSVILITNDNITQEILCQTVENLTPGCVIEQTVGKNAFEIIMSEKCIINVFELITALSGRDEIKFVAPLFIRCRPDGEISNEEDPIQEPPEKELPKFNI